MIPPLVELGANPTLCNTLSPTAEHTLDLSTILIEGNGFWVDPQIPNLDFSDPNNLDFTGVPVGTYTITFESNDAVSPCSNITAQVSINVLDCNCPIIDLEPITDFCNDNVVFNLSDFEGISDPGNWLPDPNNPQSVTINMNQVDLSSYSEGIYQFIFELQNPIANCPQRDTLGFSLFSPPSILAIRDTVVCNIPNGEKSTTIDLNRLVDAGTGIWTDQNGDVVQNPSHVDFADQPIGTDFTFTYTTNTASPPCQDVSAALTIVVVDCSCDDPVFIDPPLLCNIQGQDLDLNELLVSNHDGSWTILQSPDGGNSSLAGSVFETNQITAGNYLVQFTIEEAIGESCQKEWITELMVSNQISAELDHFGIICNTNFNNENTSYDLTENIISGNTSGIWQDFSGTVIENPSQLEFLGTPAGDYFYFYTIPNDAPCFDDVHDIKITVEECSVEPRDSNIYIPNAFSPNGDEFNDAFFPISNVDNLVIKSFQIYDRWGNKMFSAMDIPISDFQAGWKGNFNGRAIQPGVYIYYLEIYTQNNNTKSFSGDVTVVR